LIKVRYRLTAFRNASLYFDDGKTNKIKVNNVGINEIDVYERRKERDEHRRE
jgi:hypothetical protein